MISVAEARARMLAAFQALASESISLSAGLGRVLSEDLISRVTQPPAAVSAMDGYAARSNDVAKVPVALKVIGKVPAGQSYQGKVGPGEVVRIFTGAPLPQGTDCIVIQENTRSLGEFVEVLEGTPAGRYVRPAGLDFKAGSIGLPKGKRLTARDIGLAAAMNRPWLNVHRRPRVAILATGDEIVLPGDPLGPAQIVSSNAHALAAFLQAEGAEAIQLGIAPDRPDALQEMAAGAKGADLLVTTGGASVGEHDLIRDALGATGLKLDFWKIAMRPGKPLIFGEISGVPLLGLPGNPVSTLVCATLFLRPILARLQGLPEELPWRKARLGKALGENDQREDYLRARLHEEAGGLIATPFDRQDSSMLALLAGADALIRRAPLAPAAAAGSEVDVLPLAGGCLSI